MRNEKLACLQIITDVGTARSKYIEAIQAAKHADYEACNRLLKEGNDSYAKGYRAHHDLMSLESGHEEGVELSLLLVHAEDQLMSAESFKILCTEFLDIYRRFDQL